MHDNYNVAAVVVTYNRCELLIECIEALNQSDIHTDIIIVDNNSTDGTQEKTKSYVDNTDIFYFNTGKNIGGAGGFNYGIRKAYEMGYDYIWLMDDDTIIKNDSLTKLLEADKMLDGNYGFLSSLALWTDNSPCRMNYHKPAKKWQYEKDKLTYGILKIERATFVSFLLKREVIATVGLPIKEYFIWGDDTEYSMRISERYPCYLISNSSVIHKMKENQDTGEFYEINDKSRINRMFYSLRNDYSTFRRYKKRREYIIIQTRNLLMLIVHKCKFKCRKLTVFFRGVICGIFFRPKIEYILQK